MNSLFDTICVVPVITYVGPDSSTVDHVDPRVFFLKQQKIVCDQIARALTERQQMLYAKGTTNRYATYAHIAKPGVVEYCTSISERDIYIHTMLADNTSHFVTFLNQFSAMLGNVINLDSTPMYEQALRVILEHAFRSGLKVHRDVIATGLPFTVQNGMLVDEHSVAVQIDDLRRNGSPTVRDYFVRKIENHQETDYMATELFERLVGNYGKKNISTIIQQAGTFATQLYPIWNQEIGTYVQAAHCWNKN